MVKNVTITNYVGDQVEYKIEGVDVYDNNGLLITEIEGLGPTGAEIVFTKLVGANGAIYNSGRLNQRNVVIHALFTWAKTTEEARLSSYKMFPIGRRLRFDIQTDNRHAYVYGYVEKNEPNIFKSETDMMISVMCESAYLNDINEITEKSISDVEPLFEFIYENEGHYPVTEMGEFVGEGIHYLFNNGDSEAGFTMILEASGPVVNPTVIFTDLEEAITFDTNKIYAQTGAHFDSGYEIVYISETRNKSYWLRHNGVDVPLTTLLGKYAKWPKLKPGYNGIMFTADSGSNYLKIYFRFNQLYDGV